MAVLVQVPMAESNSLSSVRYRAGSFAANHPRVVLTAVLLLVLVAAQGSAAAEIDLTSPNNAGSVDTGP